MASSDRFYMPVAQAFTASGEIGVGYYLRFWVGGGAYSVAKAVYSDSTLLAPIANVDLVAGADGRFPTIFLGSGDYGVQLFTDQGVLVAAYDPVAKSTTTAATTTTAGIVELATEAEGLIGTSSSLVPPVSVTAAMIQQGFNYGGTAGGTANALTLASTVVPSALAAGMEVIGKAASTNTGAVTLNRNGLGVIAVKIMGATGPTALQGGEILIGNTYRFVYSAADSAWLVMPTAMQTAILAPKFGRLSGLGLSRASATTFGVAVGSADNEDSGSHFEMTLASAFTKSLSAWAVGTGNGGLDTGAVANATWYHIHMIRKDADNTIDFLLSTSATSPTMPSGYTARRRLGSILTNGSAQIVAFSQFGDEFLWDVAVIDVDATNPGTSAVTRTLTTPLGIKIFAMVSVGGYTGTNGFTIVASSLDVSDQAAQVTGTAGLVGFPSNAAVINGAQWDFSTHLIRTNTSSQIRSRISASGAADHIGVVTRGWVDTRGQ